MSRTLLFFALFIEFLLFSSVSIFESRTRFLLCIFIASLNARHPHPQALADALLADPALLVRSVEELFDSGTIAELLRMARALPDNLELQASIASILRYRCGWMHSKK